jgi:16S rRNA (guanine527-N7)-methyltransferase
LEKLYLASKYFGITLNTSQLEQYKLYRDELISWNSLFNLTAIVSSEAIELYHFADSLSVIPALDPAILEGTPEVVVIGTGAGFPGIPLKIALPNINLTLVDSTQKKLRFVEHVSQKLGFKNVTTVAGRAEDLSHDPRYRHRYHLALSRAVAKLPTLAELCLPFCKVNGLFIAYKKGDISEEVESSRRALNILGANLKDIVPVTFPELADSRLLVVIEKVALTPSKYPRRPGMPLKNPL